MVTKQLALLHSISAYVSQFVIRHIASHPDNPLGAWQERHYAVVLFADVSGFTKMSEKLAELGKEGAEELTRVLNQYFSTMIDLVHNYGGAIVKFGGDAITCEFPHGEKGLQMACTCALKMQEEMSIFHAVDTRGGTFSLRMKIGISTGQVLALGVGNPQHGLEYVLAGRALDQMAAAEHHATKDEVVIDGESLKNAGISDHALGLTISEKRDEFLVITDITPRINPVEITTTPWSTLDKDETQHLIDHLTPYLPPMVYQRLLEGYRQFVGEHRWVVSLFVNFMGIDYDGDPEAGQKLQQYFTAMQEVIIRYGGRLNRVITGDKGSLLHLIFGAPVAHEDNERRAVGCALEIQQITLRSNKLPFITDQRVGIASGYVFAGNVGSDSRREYTVMGDVVNLSARLMQATSSGEILMGPQTARRIEEDFICDPLPPIKVKGKKDPINVYRALGIRKEITQWGQTPQRRRITPMVGRQEELKLIRTIIKRAAQGEGQIIAITGEAGVGKSRLLEEIVTLSRKKGMYGIKGTSVSYGSQSPYLPWIDLLNTFFGIESGDSQTHEERVQKIEQQMTETSAELRDWVPLIGQLLGIPIPDNALTTSLDAQLRKQRTFEIVLALLRHRANQVPLFLVVFEDTHWIDAISLELLNYVARNIGNHRILLLALYRPPFTLPAWKRYDYGHYIELIDLPAKEALELVKYRLNMAEIPPDLEQRVLRGELQVNPFFVEEVLNALIDQGYLIAIPGDNGDEYIITGDLAEVEIPDSVQALVMSRIDRLDEGSKLTIKVASVIGRSFAYRTVNAIYPVEIMAEKLMGNLEKLNRLDLTPLERTTPNDWEYFFKHVTIQEVAYESLLYAHRRELHHSVGEYLERVFVGNLEEHYDLLAHHYSHSGNRRKSWTYQLHAGKSAQNQYANESAIAHYNQAITFAESEEEAGEVYIALGDVHQLIGQYEKANENYRAALQKLSLNSIQVTNIQRKIAKTWELQGQYDKAMQHLYMAQVMLGGAQKVPEIAALYNAMGWINLLQGEYEEALKLSRQGLSITEKLSDDEKNRRVTVELQHTLGSINLRIGHYEQAIKYFKDSVKTRESINDLYGITRAYNNMAAVYWNQGKYDLSIEYIQKCLQIQQRIGNTHGTAMSYNNLGAIYYVLGDYERAIKYYERSLNIRLELGDLQGIADLYNNMGEVYYSRANWQEAIHYLQQAAELFLEIGDKATLIDTYKLLAEVEIELDKHEAALDHGQKALALAKEIKVQEHEGVCDRVLGQIYRAMQKQEQAQRYLEESIETLTKCGNKFELGKSHYELGLALAESDPRYAQRHYEEALKIFQELKAESEIEKVTTALESVKE